MYSLSTGCGAGVAGLVLALFCAEIPTQSASDKNKRAKRFIGYSPDRNEIFFEVQTQYIKRLTVLNIRNALFLLEFGGVRIQTYDSWSTLVHLGPPGPDRTKLFVDHDLDRIDARRTPCRIECPDKAAADGDENRRDDPAGAEFEREIKLFVDEIG